jgi:hypothetical protein
MASFSHRRAARSGVEDDLDHPLLLLLEVLVGLRRGGERQMVRREAVRREAVDAERVVVVNSGRI